MTAVDGAVASRCCSFALAAAVPASGADVPYLTGRVVDNADILKPETRDRLTARSRRTSRRPAIRSSC